MKTLNPNHSLAPVRRYSNDAWERRQKLQKAGYSVLASHSGISRGFNEGNNVQKQVPADRFYVSLGCIMADGPGACLPREVCSFEGAETTAAEVMANQKAFCAVPALLTALADAYECLRRLDDQEGAYRVTCMSQIRSSLTEAGATIN